MGRKKLLTDEEVEAYHKEMVDGNVLYSVVAKAHNLRPSTLYNMFKKAGKVVNIGKRGRPAKAKELVAV